MKKLVHYCNEILALIILSGLASCNLPIDAQPTTSTINVTQAYQTVEARLTAAVALTPSATVSPVPTDSGVITDTPTSPPETSTPRPPTASVEPTVVCDQAAPGNPIDVSIPDDTEMRPGQTFTKTWRLQNAGNCTWTREYRVEFFSGEAMGAPARVSLPREIAPGQSVDISVDMVAPQSAGTYQGNWKLRNASDNWFGIGPSGTAPFWVRIVVVPLPTATLTPTLTTPTVTATPAVQASGSVILLPGYRIDLDSGQVNSGSGEDLSYEENAEGKHLIIPQGNSVLAVFGASQPQLFNCQATALSAASLIVEDITEGTYLCYRTNMGLPGRAFFTALNPDDFSLSLEILTWIVP